MIEHDLTPEQRAELGDLSALYSRLHDYEAPEPDSRKLMAALKPELDLLRVEDAPLPEPQKPSFNDWLGLAWKQTQLLGMPFWLSAFTLIGIGLACSIVYGSSLTAFFLLLVSPLFAVGGVAYLFRPATRTLWELEQFSQFSVIQLLYARLLPVLALNIATVGALLLITSAQGTQIVLWRLLALWLGPMIGMMGIALFCSIRWNTVVGIVVPVLAWAMMLSIGWRAYSADVPINLFTIDLLAASYLASDLLLAVGLIALIAGLLFFYAAGRQLDQWRSSFAA